MATSAEKIVNTDKSLSFGGNVKYEDNLAKILKVIEVLLEQVYANTDLASLDLSRFGIQCKPDDPAGILAQLFDVVLKNQEQIATSNQQVNRYVSNVQKLIGDVESFKVRVSKDSSESRYFIEAFNDTFGHIKIVNDKVSVVGLVPIGAHMYVSKTRVEDFDNTGKGKTGTDMIGWYIRNGLNGTDNALNKYVKTVATTDQVGIKAGTNKFLVTMDNIVSFKKKITGSLAQSLSDGAQFPFRLLKALRRFGTGAQSEVLIPGDGGNVEYKTDGHSFKHAHGHDLYFDHVNASPKSIELDLEHVKELPIVFLGF